MRLMTLIFGSNAKLQVISTEEIDRVRGSFAKIADQQNLISNKFYKYLFELDSSLEPLLPEEMEGQRIKFENILSQAVGGLDDLDQFVPTVRELGKKHLQPGVPDAHYAIVGAALLNTLEDIFMDEWNENLRQSWLAFYTLTALTIKSSASQAA